MGVERKRCSHKCEEKRLLNPLIKKFIVLWLSRQSKFTLGEVLTSLMLKWKLIYSTRSECFCLSIFLFLSCLYNQVRKNVMNPFY